MPMSEQFNTAFETLGKDAQWNPSWLKALRKDSYESFLATGLPSRKNEDWKYTSTRNLTESTFGLILEETATREAVEPFFVDDAHHLVFMNGVYQNELSNRPETVTIQTLREALGTDQDLIQPCLDSDGDSLTVLNQAFFSSGIFVRVKKNTVVEKPIQLLFLQRKTATNHEAMISPRNVLFIEAGAQVNIIESHFGDGASPHFTNAVSDIFVKDQAQCQYVLERSFGPDTRYVSKHTFHIGRDASVESFNLALGGKLNRSHLEFRLSASGSSAKLDGLYIGRDDNHIDNVTEVVHLAPHTSSSQLYKGVLEGNSRAVFNGKITIVKNAQKVDAQQLNKNLLMSPDAEVDSRPQLAIDANDVKCSHGATIGQIDSQELFYLQSRAISREDAKRMLASAFIGDVISRITGTHFTKHVQDVLQSFGGAVP